MPTVTNCIVWEDAAGLHVAHIVEEGRREGESDRDFHERAENGLIGRNLKKLSDPTAVVKVDDLPKESKEIFFQGDSEDNIHVRDLWRLQAGRVVIDAALLREKFMEKVRQHRAKRFAALSGTKEKLDDIGTPQQSKTLADHRQLLRDFPVVVEAQIANLTPAQLETYVVPWPDDPGL